MRDLLKRLEALEAGSTATNHEPITHFLIKPLGAEGLPWEPNYAGCCGDDGGEIWRRDDETPEQFEARAKATFPTGRISRVLWIRNA